MNEWIWMNLKESTNNWIKILKTVSSQAAWRRGVRYEDDKFIWLVSSLCTLPVRIVTQPQQISLKNLLGDGYLVLLIIIAWRAWASRELRLGIVGVLYYSPKCESLCALVLTSFLFSQNCARLGLPDASTASYFSYFIVE